MDLKQLIFLDQKRFKLALYSFAPINPASSYAFLNLISKLNKLFSCHFARVFHNANIVKLLYKHFD